MKKYLKNIIICLLTMFITVELSGIQVKAAGNVKTDTDKHYAIGYIASSSSYFTEEGAVTTDGLRLRKEPNTNSAILELMYFGELVYIDLDNSTMTFYYVERAKTGTKGYANAEYIQILQDLR